MIYWWVSNWFFWTSSSNIQMSSLKSNFPLISAFGRPRVAKFCYKRARESQTFSFFHQWRHFSIPLRHQWKSEKAFWKKKSSTSFNAHLLAFWQKSGIKYVPVHYLNTKIGVFLYPAIFKKILYQLGSYCKKVTRIIPGWPDRAF